MAGSGRQWYQSKAWRELRRWHLAQYPYCVECLHDGKAKAEAIPRRPNVDHIKPHKGCSGMFFDLTNLQTLCHSHHSRKTATEDGGFGR